jgi:hypothetical protein
MLKFSKANAKIKTLAKVASIAKFLEDKRKIYSLDKLSGWTCPFAVDCLSKVYEDNDGKRTLKDGPKTKFRCFSASQEVAFPTTYDLRKHNTDILTDIDDSIGMVKMIQESMPKNLGICRIDVGGDMFNLAEMLAWATVAEHNPSRLFYAYTKSLPYWAKLKPYIDSLDNFVLTASRGGRRDDLIDTEKLREAVVVFDEATAKNLGYEIDHDDSHAADPNKKSQSFALLIHGIQPAGSEASKAVRKLKGRGSYGKSKVSK